MSLYKWHRLQDIAKKLNIAGFVASGQKLMKEDVSLPLSLDNSAEEEEFDISNARLYNRFTQKRFLRVLDEERHAMDTSIATIHLLKLLIANADEMITGQLQIRGIIAVGRYLRESGDKVDFVKLTRWIHRLNIENMSSFQASLLIELFDFEEQELEFIKHRYVNPLVHYDKLLDNAFNDSFHFSNTSLLNISMLEKTSYHFGKITTSILNVEE